MSSQADRTTSTIESIVRRHLHEAADGTVREGQIDRVAAEVHIRRQTPAWYAGLRSPVPRVDAPPPLRAPVIGRRMTAARVLSAAAALVVIALALGWSMLGMLGGATPSPSIGASHPLPSASVAPTPGVPDCVTLPIGAVSAGCIEVAQGWTFTLGDHSPRIGPSNDLRFDVEGGTALLSRPTAWAGPARLAIAASPGPVGCLAALQSDQGPGVTAMPETAAPGVPGIDLEGVDATDVLCAISGSGHVFEVHVLALTPREVPTATRVARFAWIDWGTLR